MGCIPQEGSRCDQIRQSQYHNVRAPRRRPGQPRATRLRAFHALSRPTRPTTNPNACHRPSLKFGASVCVIGNSSVVDFKTDYDSDDTTIDLAVGAPGDDTEDSAAGQ